MFRVEQLIKDIVKFITKDRVSSCGSPRLYPLSFNICYAHVLTYVYLYSVFSNGSAGFMKFFRYFRCTVILFGFIKDSLDSLFIASFRCLVAETFRLRGTIYRARYIKNFSIPEVKTRCPLTLDAATFAETSV